MVVFSRLCQAVGRLDRILKASAPVDVLGSQSSGASTFAIDQIWSYCTEVVLRIDKRTLRITETVIHATCRLVILVVELVVVIAILSQLVEPILAILIKRLLVVDNSQ